MMNIMSIDGYKAIIKYDPVTGNNLLASIVQKNEDFAEAEAYYLKVLELESSNEKIC